MNSILEELRCMDGELFRSELTQRLYLLLKSQAQDALGSLEQVPVAQKRHVQAKLLEWPGNVRDEEMVVLRSKSSEVDNLFLQVAMLYVKLSHKSTENRVVKISRPRLEDLLKSFYQHILRNAWGSSGELWKFDPLKHDFVMRECFRKAVMDSVQIVQTAATPPVVTSSASVLMRKDTDTDIGPDDSISNFLQSDSRRDISFRDIVPNLPPPSGKLTRSPAPQENAFKDDDTISRSSSSSSSSTTSFDLPHPSQRQDEELRREAVFASSDNEFLRASKSLSNDDGATVIRGSSDWDKATLVQRQSSDNASVHTSRQLAADARTVTFQLPRHGGSVVSSVSDSSQTSRYQSATLSKPKVLPVTMEDDSEVEEAAQEEQSSLSNSEDEEGEATLKINLVATEDA